MKNIAILASGTGSNANEVAKYFAISDDVNVSIILTNNPQAGVLQVAERRFLPSVVISRQGLQKGDLLKILNALQIDLVVLAGFLLMIPPGVVEAYEGRIVNIHPALLPKYGGKGMYGMRVHEAVSAAGDTETGITIHYVNEKYDEGDIIAQYRVPIKAHEDPELIREKVQELEHKYYPRVIAGLLNAKRAEN